MCELYERQLTHLDLAPLKLTEKSQENSLQILSIFLSALRVQVSNSKSSAYPRTPKKNDPQ